MESVRVILDIHHFGVLMTNELTLDGYLLDIESRARWVYYLESVMRRLLSFRLFINILTVLC